MSELAIRGGGKARRGFPLIAPFLFAGFVCITHGACAAPPASEEVYRQRRLVMVKDQIKLRGVDDEATLRAMEEVPRHVFVPENQRAYAYHDYPLPIGYGQTISQPYIVAAMTELLQLKPEDKVLEVGTGSGYQAAVLAEIVDEVYSIEILKPLGEEAAERLKRLGYENATVKVGDGYLGWPKHAPFDAIIVTAAPKDVPEPLVEQLKVDGRMCIPVGEDGAQSLYLLTKQADGTLKTESVFPVRFVPLVRETPDGL